MWRRIVASFAALSLAAFAFAGCEKKGGGDEQDQKEKSAEKKEAEKDQKKAADEESKPSEKEGGVAMQGPDVRESMKEAADEFAGENE